LLDHVGLHYEPTDLATCARLRVLKTADGPYLDDGKAKRSIERDDFIFESSSRSNFFLDHDLLRKPVPTFRDHALATPEIRATAEALLDPLRLRSDALRRGPGDRAEASAT
jgi:hypothetical protein